MEFKVGIVGLGFVGTAVETGFQDIPGVDIRVHDKFKDTESLRIVVDHSDIIFLCLPTPMNEDRSCDTSIIDRVARSIHTMCIPTCSSPDFYNHKTLVIKSTVPPGTTNRLAEKYPEQTFVFNPEFLTERHFILDFLNQDRIFIGIPPRSDNRRVRQLTDLYGAFIKTQHVPGSIYKVDSNVAEMLKYTTNCFLATKVSFFNEMYDICKAANIDFNKVIQMMRLDNRIGGSHMDVPGFENKRGWGGSCFPKDLNALVAFAEEHDVDALMLESAWVKNLSVREENEWEDLAQVTGKYVKKE